VLDSDLVVEPGALCLVRRLPVVFPERPLLAVVFPERRLLVLVFPERRLLVLVEFLERPLLVEFLEQPGLLLSTSSGRIGRMTAYWFPFRLNDLDLQVRLFLGDFPFARNHVFLEPLTNQFQP